MSIRIATTDSEIAACYPVMRELRPHIEEDQFLSWVRSQENTGYRLAFVQQTEGVVAFDKQSIGLVQSDELLCLQFQDRICLALSGASLIAQSAAQDSWQGQDQ